MCQRLPVSRLREMVGPQLRLVESRADGAWQEERTELSDSLPNSAGLVVVVLVSWAKAAEARPMLARDRMRMVFFIGGSLMKMNG